MDLTFFPETIVAWEAVQQMETSCSRKKSVCGASFFPYTHIITPPAFKSLLKWFSNWAELKYQGNAQCGRQNSDSVGKKKKKKKVQS